MKAICKASVIPLRSRSTHAGEMISQVLFGELLEILDRKGRAWYKVRCISDNNFGWVSAGQVQILTEEEFNVFKIDFAFILELTEPVRTKDNHYPVPIGSRLPGFDGMRFIVNGVEYNYSGQAVNSDVMKSSPFELLPKIARKFLNSPEMQGGRSPFGIDSAGLVQMLFSFIEISLPRYPDLQVGEGSAVDFIEEAQVGDIAFFENKQGKITHCGLIIEERKIIHSFGVVKIDSIDHFGIFDETISAYTHRLRIIKRKLPKFKLPVQQKVKDPPKVLLPKALF